MLDTGRFLSYTRYVGSEESQTVSDGLIPVLGAGSSPYLPSGQIKGRQTTVVLYNSPEPTYRPVPTSGLMIYTTFT